MQIPVEAAAKRYSENKYGADLGSQLVRAADMATLANDYGWVEIIRENSNRMSSDLVKTTKTLREVEKQNQILTATIAQRDESLAIVRRLREDDCKLIRELQKRPEMQNEMVVEETIRNLNKIIDGQVEENRQLSAKVNGLHGQISTWSKANNNQAETIRANDVTISQLKYQIKDLHAGIADARNIVANRDVEIEGLKALVKQKDENDKIHTEIIESKDFMIKIKTGTIRELNEQIEQLQAY